MVDTEKIKNFILDPYKAIIISLILIVLINFNIQGGTGVLSSVALIVLVSVIVDSAIGYVRLKRLYVSETALISGLILSLVIAPQTPIEYLIAAPVLAQLSKHIIRYKNKPVFNPATLGMFLVFLVFPAGEAWWGNLNSIAALVLGLYISWRIARLPSSFLFLIAFVIFNLIKDVLTGGAINAAILPSLALSQAFLAFFMVVEPKSSTHKPLGQMVYGAIVALIAVIAFALSLPAPLLLALLIGNVVATFYK